MNQAARKPVGPPTVQVERQYQLGDRVMYVGHEIPSIVGKTFKVTGFEGEFALVFDGIAEFVVYERELKFVMRLVR